MPQSDMISELRRQRQTASVKRANLAGDVATGTITKKEAARRRPLYDKVIARADKILGPREKKTTSKGEPTKKKPGAFSREAAKQRQDKMGRMAPGISGILNMEEIAKRGREKKAGQ